MFFIVFPPDLNSSAAMSSSCPQIVDGVLQFFRPQSPRVTGTNRCIRGQGWCKGFHQRHGFHVGRKWYEWSLRNCGWISNPLLVGQPVWLDPVCAKLMKLAVLYLKDLKVPWNLGEFGRWCKSSPSAQKLCQYRAVCAVLSDDPGKATDANGEIGLKDFCEM